MPVGRGERDVRVVARGADELGAVAGAATAMAGRLAAQEEARRALLAAISHDLRTPITSLRLLTDGLREEVITGRRAEGRARADGPAPAPAQRPHRRSPSTSPASRPATSPGRRERVRLPVLVGEIVDALRPEAEAGGVDVRSRIPDDLLPVSADPERLQRVLFNLLHNAIRHTPADGEVVVLAEPRPERLEIEVADTGTGIAAAAQPRVFEPFFRGGDAAARTGAGAGLGLAIARAIVEAHGGRIWLEPASGGTRVRFSLRYADAAGGPRGGAGP